jgi:hypothetical protein
MAATDNGSQIIRTDYKQPLTTESFNEYIYKGIEPGIYEGGALTYLGNIVTIAPFQCYIKTTNAIPKTLKIYTQTPATKDASGGGNLANPAYLYMTYTWANTELNYLDFALRPISNPPVNGEIILGTVTFDNGGNVTGVSQNGITVPRAANLMLTGPKNYDSEVTPNELGKFGYYGGYLYYAHTLGPNGSTVSQWARIAMASLGF